MKKACHKNHARRVINSTFYILHSAFLRGFTLLELLVVISIIAILAGMVMPTFYYAKRRAREAKARVMVKQLETAFKSYLDTYKVWPDAWPDGDIKDDMFKTLHGENPGTPPMNPQCIAFYEFESTTNYPSSYEFTALDPWSNPSDSSSFNAYQVMFDKDYDNKITINGKDVYRCVLVWSFGETRTNEYGEGDDVASWK